MGRAENPATPYVSGNLIGGQTLFPPSKVPEGRIHCVPRNTLFDTLTPLDGPGKPWKRLDRELQI